MAGEKRGYQPSVEEMERAEKMMSKSERRSSKDREAAYNAGKDRGQNETKIEMGLSAEELVDAYVDTTVHPDDERARQKLAALVEARVKSDPEVLRQSFIRKAVSEIKNARSPDEISLIRRTIPRDVMRGEEVRAQIRETGRKLLIEGLQQGSLSAVREYDHAFGFSESTLNHPEVIKALKKTITSRIKEGSFESKNLYEVYRDYGGLPVEITSDKKIQDLVHTFLRVNPEIEFLFRLP